MVRTRSLIRKPSVIHDLPKYRFYNDISIRKADQMEIEAFKNGLDGFIDLIAADNEKMCTDRPRFVHAVAVLADPNKSGEIMKATCIKQLDSFHVVVKTDKKDYKIEKIDGVDEVIQGPIPRKSPLLEESIENRQKRDNEIEAALRILQESKEMLDETAFNCRFPSEVRARKAAIAKNQS